MARKRHLVKMLVLMVLIFTVCWVPFHIVNVVRDANQERLETDSQFTETLHLVFVAAHLLAVSATCWNPILYGLMNENFRREFRAVLPCFGLKRRFSVISCESARFEQSPVSSLKKQSEEVRRKISSIIVSGEQTTNGTCVVVQAINGKTGQFPLKSPTLGESSDEEDEAQCEVIL